MKNEKLAQSSDAIINVYTDESSHINDGSKIMVIGSIWMEPSLVAGLTDKIKLIKVRHDVSPHREIKWTKVSNKKLDYYKDLIDFFVSMDGMNFRAVIIDKTKLDHERFGHTTDDFYYIMQYYLIRNIAERCFGNIRIYLDYKDTWSGKRSHKLSEYLSKTGKIHAAKISAQPIRSHESIAIQFADLISGAVMFANKQRVPGDSNAKLELVKYIEKSIGQSLNNETPYTIEKFNLFFWEPRQ